MKKLMIGMALAALAAGVLDGQGARADAVECRARDSRTGKIVGMFADTEGEPSALLQYSKYTYTAGAKLSLKKLTEDVVKACGTKIEDRAKLRRSFPIDFIALPWENDLDKKVKGMLK